MKKACAYSYYALGKSRGAGLEPTGEDKLIDHLGNYIIDEQARNIVGKVEQRPYTTNGLVLFHDLTSADNLVLNGSKISVFKDLSTNGNDSTQVIEASQPTFDPILERAVFSSANSMNAVSATDNNESYTFFSVSKLYAGAGLVPTIYGNNAKLRAFRYRDLRYACAQGAGYQTTSTATYLNENIVGMVSYDTVPSNIIQEIDGGDRQFKTPVGAYGTAASEYIGRYGTGSASYFVGELSVIMMYNRALTDGEILKTTNYLIDNYK